MVLEISGSLDETYGAASIRRRISAIADVLRRISVVADVLRSDGRQLEELCEGSVTHGVLARARSGDEDAFRALTEPYRQELHLHCYRLLGSAQDAEDLVQETMLAAWRGLEQFEARASLRAWLYRIATNRSLDALRQTARRPRTTETMSEAPKPTRITEPVWLEPYPDILLEEVMDTEPGPDARYETRESIALAFIAGLQRLAPQQRAVIVLRDVLGFHGGEVADMLRTSEASVDSTLRRARAALESRVPASARDRTPLPNSPQERTLIGQFVDAVEGGDIDRVVALLADEAWLRIPPQPHEYQGPHAIGALLEQGAIGRQRGLRLVPTRANGQPAFGCYLPCPPTPIARPYGFLVLTLSRNQISELTWFANTGFFSTFGLPRILPT